MAENAEEATHVWCHRKRLVFFFAAMRHFREFLKGKGYTVHYHALSEDGREDSGRDFRALLAAGLKTLRPATVRVVEPGDHRVRAMLEAACEEAEVPLEILEDTHFYLPLTEFREWASGRREFILETFYRMMRKRTGILLDEKGKPEGGEWNYDADNRRSFGKDGPPAVRLPPTFEPDAITQGVIAMVRARFGDHPGELEPFDLPVTRKDALASLQAFIGDRLPTFGDFQDAMWTGEHFGSHSRLSPLLNVKLLNSREVVGAALKAYRAEAAPLNAVEGFVRQIIGWREYVRGIYYTFGPEYLERNALEAEEEVPTSFWSGKTSMRCVASAMENVLKNGYAHHIERLMVLGLYAQLFGVNPRKFHEWHLALYLDAIDWVSAPNTIGMSQFGDGGIVGTKPYCASGNYINKMSNFCRECRFDPKKAEGPEACPMTTLYYDFLDRHRARFADNRRMTFQLKNLERKSQEELSAIRDQAAQWRSEERG